MEDLKFLFENTEYNRPQIRRSLRLDDPSHPFRPSTDNYHSKSYQPTDSLTLQHHSLSDSDEEDSKLALVDKANKSLQEALEHSNRDVVIKNTLELLLEQFEDKIESYHSEHPEPGSKPELLKEPEWSKGIPLSVLREKGKPSPLSRVGTEPKSDTPPIVSELEMKSKALSAGMSLSEIKEADSVIDRIFDVDKKSFRKKF